MNATIERVFDAAEVNRIANDPEIFAQVSAGHPYPLDMTPVVENPANVTFVGAHGAVIFAACGKGVFEAHAAVLPEGRAEWAMDAGHEAVRRMFRNHGAIAILFPCPRNNAEAHVGARILGAKPLGRVGDCDVYRLTKAEIG